MKQIAAPLTPTMREELAKLAQQQGKRPYVEVFGSSPTHAALRRRGLIQRVLIGMRWYRIAVTADGRKEVNAAG